MDVARSDFPRTPMIVPHTEQMALVWWIDEQIEDAEDVLEWSGALAKRKAGRVR